MVVSVSTRALPAQRPLRRLDARTWLGVAFSGCLLAAFFAVPYLPMVDLAQHAAQLSIWLHLGDPQFADASRFSLNLRTPYIGAYLLARLFAAALPVIAALKLLVWLSVVAHALAFAALVKRLGHAPWLGLLGLPLAFGYAFYYGFISFNAALPCCIGSLCAVLAHRERPTIRSGCELAALLCLTLVAHGFAFGMTALCALPLLLGGAFDPGAAPSPTRFLRGCVQRFAPFVAPALLTAVWLVPGSSARSIGLTLWEPRFLSLAQVPALLLAASGADLAATLLGIAMLALVGMSLGRPAREREKLCPLVLMLLGYCLFPLSLSGFSPLHPRFAAFIVPTLLIAFEPRRSPALARLPAWVLVTTCVWLALFLTRLRAFTTETRPLTDFVSRMPGGLHLRPLVFESGSRVYPALPVAMHLPAYYFAEKGGRQGYSFAMYPTSVIRYVPSVTPTMGGGAEWHPETFSADIELDGYDCFLVHSERDRSSELFGEREAEVELVFHEQDWWAYFNRASDRARRSAAPRGGKSGNGGV